MRCQFLSTTAYNLDLDATGSSIAPVGTVTLTSNSRADTLTYRFSLSNGGKLIGAFLDAGTGGSARRDVGPVTNTFGSFTDSFTAHGRSFSVTFRGTDVANFTLVGTTDIFASVTRPRASSPMS
jgi:hypothetical protein